MTLSLADAVVMEQRLGISNTVRFIEEVDPWRYPGEETRAPCGIKWCLQGALDKVKKADNSGIKIWTPVSTNAFLLSPLLVRKRPELVRLSRAAPSGSKSSGHLTDLTHMDAAGTFSFSLCLKPVSVFRIYVCLLSLSDSIALSPVHQPQVRLRELPKSRRVCLRKMWAVAIPFSLRHPGKQRPNSFAFRSQLQAAQKQAAISPILPTWLLKVHTPSLYFFTPTC